MFTKLPKFVACNLKCDLLVLQRLLKCSVNDTEMVIGVLMGLKAKGSTFREFCEKCMKSLCSSISNTDELVFFFFPPF